MTMVDYNDNTKHLYEIVQILKQWNIYWGRQWQHKSQEDKIVPYDHLRKKKDKIHSHTDER